MTSLAQVLDSLTAEGELFDRLQDGSVRCYACAHRCLVRPGKRGICQVRFNRDGTLRVPWGYVGGLQSDPVEKKPFYHLLPGSDALTFGMLGCDFHCAYCQNWVSSQALRDPASDVSGAHIRPIEPSGVVGYGVRTGAQVIASSYNEPLITSEWAVAIFKEAVAAGLICAYVSNGNATPEVLEYLKPYLSGLKIDLKTMQDRQYRRLGGVLANVLDSIKRAHEMGIWVEVVTLVVPGFNDSNEELMDTGTFIASVSPDIPWHVTGFHKDYRMREPDNTSSEILVRAAEIGQEAGLRYVYAGNLPGRVRSYEDTLCPDCGELLVGRLGYLIRSYHLTDNGGCPKCGTMIPGMWPKDAGSVGRGSARDLFQRRPRAL